MPNHASKEPLLTAYGLILGIPSANLVWTYLNKGTHEEEGRDDFDSEVVEVVVRTLEALDAIDLRPKKQSTIGRPFGQRLSAGRTSALCASGPSQTRSAIGLVSS